MVLVFQKNVKVLEIGIRRGVIILRVDITSYHRHRQVAYERLAIIGNILWELRTSGAVGRDPFADIVLHIELMVWIFAWLVVGRDPSPGLLVVGRDPATLPHVHRFLRQLIMWIFTKVCNFVVGRDPFVVFVWSVETPFCDNCVVGRDPFVVTCNLAIKTQPIIQSKAHG